MRSKKSAHHLEFDMSKPKIVHFAGHDCTVQVERYVSNGHTALFLYDAKNGEPVATATVNLRDFSLQPNQVFIKDYSENKGMLAALQNAGIIEVQGCYVPTEIGMLPVCKLLIEPPVPEKGHQRSPHPQRTGFADSHGDFAKELLADMEQKAQDQPEQKSKDRDFGMDW
jgi:hypothetical protein